MRTDSFTVCEEDRRTRIVFYVDYEGDTYELQYRVLFRWSILGWNFGRVRSEWKPVVTCQRYQLTKGKVRAMLERLRGEIRSSRQRVRQQRKYPCEML